MNAYKSVFLISGIILSVYFNVVNTLTLGDIKCHMGPYMYPEGEFSHPTNSCSKCVCNADGSYVCQSVCTTPQCGKDLYRTDTCNCTVCSKICDNINPPCDDVTCQKSHYYYQPNSCCPECRCWYEGVQYERGPFGEPCDKCRCQANWQITCNRPACPTVKLTCPDAEFDKDCNYVCPKHEKTCQQGPVTIRYGEFKRVGSKVCTCVGSDWYPRAFCAKRMRIGDEFKKLMKRRCVANPSTFDTWKQIEALY